MAFPVLQRGDGRGRRRKFGAADTMLFGRKTYDSFAGAWPEREAAGEEDAGFAKQLGDVRKLVASHQELDFTWRNSEQLEGDLVEAVTALKSQPGANIALSGSVSVVRQLLAAGLLDELHLLVHPIAVRKGMRLFDEGETPVPLKLISSETFETGVLNLVYAPAEPGEATYEDAKANLPQSEQRRRSRGAPGRGERRRALHGAVRRPCRPADPPRHGGGRVDALVGGGFRPAARRLRPVRDPLRPPRHRPIGHLRAGTPRVHRRRPGRRRRRRARGVRHLSRARGRRLGGRGVRAAARARLPRHVLSLVLISTSPATPGERGLPTERYAQFLTTAEVDWSRRGSAIEYLVGYARMLAGGRRPFDEAAVSELVRRDVERARDIAASENHGLIADGEPPRALLSSIAVPTS